MILLLYQRYYCFLLCLNIIITVPWKVELLTQNSLGGTDWPLVNNCSFMNLTKSSIYYGNILFCPEAWIRKKLILHWCKTINKHKSLGNLWSIYTSCIGNSLYWNFQCIKVILDLVALAFFIHWLTCISYLMRMLYPLIRQAFRKFLVWEIFSSF